ncbi:MAG: class I SAM-dependent methyltransferase [Planctomycetes bacterium]|nr:class I SAM-dependent methyltransferase [Planctomycetota bacterium]
MMRISFVSMALLCLLVTHGLPAQPSDTPDRPSVDDAKVRAFLAARRGTWRDMNVPESDGQLLHDLVLKNKYKAILEIGTSTGHSTIWLAWACSKTGGKVTTLEIDEGRHKQALANFKEAGLQDTIDARLGDAHQLVQELNGTFDFVFSDADKDWYKNYFIHAYPKLKVGGCFTAHNISRRRGGGIGEFMDYIESVPGMETKVDSSGRGVSISYKRSRAPLPGIAEALDAKVKAFLENRRGTWHDLNVPEVDGKLLHSLVVDHKYQDVLEIGTSTGHSTIWLAWACSKTGGMVTTIEIDEGRRKVALANLAEAGLLHYVDSRLADAHALVKQLEGPFDFVFSDADKGWYKNYFVDVYPKLKEGGCFTAHNVSMRGGRSGGGIQEFLDHLKTVPGLETTINTGSSAGVSISYKKPQPSK